MAAPTNVRVESTSLTSATVRWTYPGANAVDIYRSTDGISYSLITSQLLGVVSYENLGLNSATKYWYKLSDDAGSTFSSIVTVITQSCPGNVTSTDMIALPLASGENVDSQTFNELSTKVQSGLVKYVSPTGQTCLACISDGALVIDCINYDGCGTIEIVVDQNINSISMPNCQDATVDLMFIVPPGATRGIGGWPKGSGFTGDEGFTSPISGGAANGSGRIVLETWTRGTNDNTRSGKSKPAVSNQGTASGGQSIGSGVAGGCNCTPGSNGELTLVACNPDGTPNPSLSLNCSGTTKNLSVIACGGRGPYTFSKTGGVTLSSSTGSKSIVSPPVNSGSGVAGNAYQICSQGYVGSSLGTCICGLYGCIYKCDDSLSAFSSGPAGCTTPIPTLFREFIAGACMPTCTPPASTCNAVCSPSIPTASINCSTIPGGGTMNDMRSGAMISAGCNPCGLNAGSTVSVTDSLGTVYTLILSA